MQDPFFSNDDRPSNSASPRATLAKLARAAKGGVIAVDEAAEVLAVPRRAAALKLAAMTRQGWLARVRRGLYVVTPLETEPGRPVTPDDPWIVAKAAFAPCYIGGWSAAEHWGLTEQMFRSTLVVTAAHVRSRSVTLLGHEFRLFHVPTSRIKDATLVWRGADRVQVSNRERTIVDCLRNPELCGGVRHLADMMREYLSSEEYDPNRLLAVTREIGNGATWKRLGYLVEILAPDEMMVIEGAKGQVTAGNVKLDPAVERKGVLSRRWRLWINVLKQEGELSA